MSMKPIYPTVLMKNTIKSLIDQEAYINSIGCGDNSAASLGKIGGIYKLVAVEREAKLISKIKVTNDIMKTINLGIKKYIGFMIKNRLCLGSCIDTGR